MNLLLNGGERCKAAVTAADHVFPADDVRKSHETLGDELGVLDQGRRMRDDTRDNEFSLGNFDILPVATLRLRIHRR